jgi:hypothetical protein
MHVKMVILIILLMIYYNKIKMKIFILNWSKHHIDRRLLFHIFSETNKQFLLFICFFIYKLYSSSFYNFTKKTRWKRFSCKKMTIPVKWIEIMESSFHIWYIPFLIFFFIWYWKVLYEKTTLVLNRKSQFRLFIDQPCR